MRPSDRLYRLALAAVVASLAFILRNWYANVVPGLTDEYSYMAQTEAMRQALAVGDYQIFIGPVGQNDHPHLVKALFALRVMSGGGADPLRASRDVSIAFGTLAVFVLALDSPVAGMLLAIQSSAIKYTGVAMLEAVPQAMIVVSVLALRHSRPDRLDRYFILSAAALGVMAAAKFIYLPLALVVFYMLHLDRRHRRPAKLIIVYYSVAFLTFMLLMPPLWLDPVGYLRGMLEFHVGFTQGQVALSNRLPWYQPFIWMMRPTPDYQELFPFSFDFPILILGTLGLGFLSKREGWIAVWLTVGLTALLLWPNKWPQYPMLLYPALALSAARFIQRWPPRHSLIVATIILAFTLRRSAVLDLPVAEESYEVRTVRGALELADSLRRGSVSELPTRLRDSPNTLIGLAYYSGVFMLRDALRPGGIDLEHYTYLGRYMSSLFSTAAIGLVAFESLPAAALLAIHSAVLGESVRADLGSIGQFFVVLGFWTTRWPPRYRRLTPVCLALGIAIMPAYLLVVLPLLTLFPGRVLQDRRDYLLFASSLALMLTDVLLQPFPKAQAWLVSSNLPAGWWHSTAVTQHTGLLSEFGNLPLYVDALILISALAGLILMRRRLALLVIVVSLLTLLAPLGYRPWYLICGPLWAYSASRFYAFVAHSFREYRVGRQIGAL